MGNNYGESDLLLWPVSDNGVVQEPHYPPGIQFTQSQQGLPGLSNTTLDYFAWFQFSPSWMFSSWLFCPLDVFLVWSRFCRAVYVTDSNTKAYIQLSIHWYSAFSLAL